MTAAGEVRTKAVHGVAWTVATGLGTRVLQIAGTLVLTHFVQRDAVGEATNAAIVALTAHTLTTFGVPNYLVSRKTDRAAAWHATLVLTASGLLASAIVLLLQAPLSGWLKSPELGRYLPWLVLSAMLARTAMVPERLLQQRLQFREASRARAAGELAYTLVSVALAVRGWGAMAIAAGNLARSVVSLAALSLAMPPREWAVPQRYDPAVVREMLAFGLPLGVANALAFAARNWDNAIVSALFGTGVVGAYNLAYNLADVPASQIGEQVGDVLTPSFVHVDEASRKRGLVRATALLGLVVFPLAIGLGVTATTVTATLMGPSWAPVGPMLMVLAAFSVVRPIGWTIGSYLQATRRTRAVMWLSTMRLAAVFASVYGFGRAFGPLGACAGVVLAFTLHAVASAGLVVRSDRIPAAALFGAAARPLLACGPLVLAVLGARAVVASLGATPRGVGLAAEVAAGAAGYAVGTLIFSRSLARECLALAGELRRKRSKSSAPPAAPAAPAAVDPPDRDGT